MSDQQVYDYEGHEEEQADNEDIIASLVEMSEELATLKSELDDAEAEVKRKKAQVDHLERERIPQIMDKLNLEEFATKTHKIEIKEVVAANISKANQDEAFDWLDDNGHGGMIKRNVVVAFDRDQQEAVEELLTELRGDYPTVKQECKLNAQTLKAWVRQQLEEGETIPPSISYERIPLARIKKKTK